MTEVDKAELKRREREICAEWGGIYPPFEAFYIYSILYSSDRAISAFERYDSALSADDAPLAVSTVQEALAHAAALSRFFWPSRASLIAESRAKSLRDAFSVTESSPLKNRHLRNAFEHFDERLDQFLLGDRVGCFFPAPMVAEHSLADDPIGQIFRLLDPEASCLVLLNEKYFFGPVRQSVEEIVGRARSMAEIGRLHPHKR